MNNGFEDTDCYGLHEHGFAAGYYPALEPRREVDWRKLFWRAIAIVLVGGFWIGMCLALVWAL